MNLSKAERKLVVEMIKSNPVTPEKLAQARKIAITHSSTASFLDKYKRKD